MNEYQVTELRMRIRKEKWKYITTPNVWEYFYVISFLTEQAFLPIAFGDKMHTKHVIKGGEQTQNKKQNELQSVENSNNTTIENERINEQINSLNVYVHQ